MQISPNRLGFEQYIALGVPTTRFEFPWGFQLNRSEPLHREYRAVIPTSHPFADDISSPVLQLASEHHPTGRPSGRDEHHHSGDPRSSILLRIRPVHRGRGSSRAHLELQHRASGYQRPRPVQFDGRHPTQKRGSILSRGQRRDSPSRLRQLKGNYGQPVLGAEPSVPVKRKRDGVGVYELHHRELHPAHGRSPQFPRLGFHPVYHRWVHRPLLWLLLLLFCRRLG